MKLWTAFFALTLAACHADNGGIKMLFGANDSGQPTGPWLIPPTLPPPYCPAWDASAYSCGPSDGGMDGGGCVLDDEFGGSTCSAQGLDLAQWHFNTSWIASGTSLGPSGNLLCSNIDAVSVGGGVAQLRVQNQNRAYCPSDWDASLVTDSGATGATQYDVSVIQSRVAFYGDYWIEFQGQLGAPPSWPTEGIFGIDCQAPSIIGAYNNGGSYFDGLFHNAGICTWALPAGVSLPPFGITQGSGESDVVDSNTNGSVIGDFYSCYDAGPLPDGSNTWNCPQYEGTITQGQFPWFTNPFSNFHTYTVHVVSGVSETIYIDSNLVTCAIAPGQPNPYGCEYTVVNMFNYPMFWSAIMEMRNGVTYPVDGGLVTLLHYVRGWCTNGTKSCASSYE